jgi:hypothetical protein
MKRLAAIFLLLGSLAVYGQQYRLVYDPATIPELYSSTRIVLEERTDEGYEAYRGKYKVRAQTGALHGLDFSYDPEKLRELRGKIPFLVEVRGEKLNLDLSLPVLTEIRFNLYTDSIKPILNYYVNVEGVFSSGRVFPLTEEQVTLTSDIGTIKGMEWIAPPRRDFDRVIFTATPKADPALGETVTVYLKRVADPRDAEGYGETPRRR